MFRIAICDASKEYRNVTADIWRRAFFDEEDLTFSFYATGGEVVEAIEDGTFVHDVLILDLLLPDLSGLRLLNFVRGQFQDLTIILQERQGIGYIRAAGQCPGDRHGLLQNMRRFIFLIYDTETGSSPRGPYGHL